jgi:hypothetical protein
MLAESGLSEAALAILLKNTEEWVQLPHSRPCESHPHARSRHLAEVPATGAYQRSPRSVGKGVPTAFVNSLSPANCAFRRASGGRGQLDAYDKCDSSFAPVCIRTYPSAVCQSRTYEQCRSMLEPSADRSERDGCWLACSGRTPDAAASPHAIAVGTG